MDCHEFTRDELVQYAYHWSFEMPEGLWDKIWHHTLNCESCRSVIRQAYRNRDKETASCRKLFPNLSKMIESPQPFNWQEIWFKYKRRRKLEFRESIKKKK